MLSCCTPGHEPADPGPPVLPVLTLETAPAALAPAALAPTAPAPTAPDTRSPAALRAAAGCWNCPAGRS